MAFVDEVTIHASAGKGGDGVVRWLRLRGKDKGGPSGGDGGRGGDVVLEGVRDLAMLSRYRFEKEFRAQDGGNGGNDLCHGADGEPITLPVPIGTFVRVMPQNEEYDITTEGKTTILLKGGVGGKGNARFKSSTNRNPFQSTPGKAGQSGNIELSLKIIADAGLIGLPNAGKSSLLNALTHAKSKVGSYPFTTLEPNLGDFYGYIIADIPGLIEGASGGKGLGIRFLKHIERTGFLLHLVSANQQDPLDGYREVRTEIERFGHGLPEKLEIVVLSKVDLVDAGKRETLRELLVRGTGKEVFEVSMEDTAVLKSFTDKLSKRFRQRA